MTLKIDRNLISGCGIGISIPKDADGEIGANEISNCGIAIELRDPPSFLETIGLTEDTPIKKVISVLEAVSGGATDKDAIEEEVKKVGLLDYLSGAANLSTLVTAFYQLSCSSLVQQAIALLTK